MEELFFLDIKAVSDTEHQNLQVCAGEGKGGDAQLCRKPELSCRMCSALTLFACSLLAAPEEPSTAAGGLCVQLRGVPGKGVQD